METPDLMIQTCIWISISFQFVSMIVFLITIFKVWKILSNDKYARKNEFSMIGKVFISATTCIGNGLTCYTMYSNRFDFSKNDGIIDFKQAFDSVSYLENVILTQQIFIFSYFVSLSIYLWWSSGLRPKDYEDGVKKSNVTREEAQEIHRELMKVEGRNS
jgi:hypothetical protein